MGRPIEGAGDERSLTRDERSDSGLQLLARGPGSGIEWTRLVGSDPGQGLQCPTEPYRARRVRLGPLPRPAHEQPKLLDRLCHLLTGGNIPRTPVIAVSAGKPLEPGGGTGDLGLACHERRAAQHPGQTQEFLASRRRLVRHQMLEPVKTLSSLEGKEIRGAEWVGH